MINNRFLQHHLKTKLHWKVSPFIRSFLESARCIGTSEAINTSKYGGKQNHKTSKETTETPMNT